VQLQQALEQLEEAQRNAANGATSAAVADMAAAQKLIDAVMARCALVSPAALTQTLTFGNEFRGSVKYPPGWTARSLSRSDDPRLAIASLTTSPKGLRVLYAEAPDNRTDVEVWLVASERDDFLNYMLSNPDTVGLGDGFTVLDALIREFRRDMPAEQRVRISPAKRAILKDNRLAASATLTMRDYKGALVLVEFAGGELALTWCGSAEIPAEQVEQFCQNVLGTLQVS
jgi:hypothetical protein